jgi:hypothetical protein
MRGFVVFISMAKKFKVILTEQELVNLFANQMLGNLGNQDTNDFTSYLSSYLKGLNKNNGDTSSKTSKSSTTSNISGLSTAGTFTPLDLNTPQGYNAYKTIADKFISQRSSNLLGITGDMLARAAKNTYNKFNKYVPVELALAQLATEGGFASNPNARPIRTKNPFNVGNVDTGKNVYHSSVEDGIQTYFDLIAKNYLVGKTASDLLDNFTNSSNQRYASGGYENVVKKIANQTKGMSEPIYASLGISKGSNIA